MKLSLKVRTQIGGCFSCNVGNRNFIQLQVAKNENLKYVSTK